MMTMDLFTPIVADDLQHQNFRRFLSEARGAEREVLRGWADGFEDRDGKFVREFQTTFNSCFWELYLHAAFRKSALSIDFSRPAPDFSLTNERFAFTAEATIASNAAGFARESESDPNEDLTPERMRAMLDYASVRLANALDGKLRKFRESYSKLEHVKDRPFVVCLAPFDQPFFYTLADRPLRRLLYSFDLPLFVDDSRTGERIILGSSRPDRVWKSATSDVPFGLFTDERAREISAVLFSNTATSGKVQALAKSEWPAMFTAARYNANSTQPSLICEPRESYQEELLDGLHVFLNPHAAIPFDPSVFDPRLIAVHRGFDEDLGIVRSDTPDGFLFSRSVATKTPLDPKKHGPRVPVNPGRPARLEPWPNGELRAVGGTFTAYSQVHLAHYDGWTILVAWDRFDDEWGAQAAHGAFTDLFSYFQGAKADPDAEMLTEFFPSREDAFAAMRQHLDNLAAQNQKRRR